MKRVFAFLLCLIGALNLSAQCADFTLVSVTCNVTGEQTFTVSANFPPDWFGEVDLYFVDVATEDTLTVILPDFPMGETSFTSSIQDGEYDLTLELIGLCQETIRVSLPEACGDFAGPNSVSGQTWFDVNQDGIRQPDEVGIMATVFLELNQGTIISRVTSPEGEYAFSDIPNGEGYTLRFEPLTDDLLFPTQFQVGEDPTVDSDMGADFRAGPYALFDGQDLPNIDAGFLSCGLQVTVANDSIGCADGCNGELSAEVTGGEGPYTYEWANGAITPTITNLCAGFYSVTVTDGNGCFSTAIGNVREENDLSVVITTSSPSSPDQCDGDVEIIVTGGTPPYAYFWSSDGNPIGTQQNLENVCFGNYVLQIIDADGCSLERNVTLGGDEPITVTEVVTNAACFGACDGSIELTVTGGTGDFSIFWNDGTFGPINSGLCAGTYSVEILDVVTGNLETRTYAIEEAAEISVSVEITDDDCSADCAGAATIVASGGVPPYTYDWGISQDGASTLTDLCPGNYSVTLSDAQGCSAAVSFLISDGGFGTSINRSGGDCDPDGGPLVSEVVVAGGVAPYNYVWSDGSTESTFPAGDPLTLHSVTITDQSGCVDVLTNISAGSITTVNIGDFTLSACDDLLVVVAEINPFLGGENLVLLPSGDTVSYSTDIALIEDEDYAFIGISANRTCQVVTRFRIVFSGLPDNIGITERFRDDCGAYGCLQISGTFFGELPTLTITGPNGYVNSPPLFDPVQNCDRLPGPGLYTATLDDGCETVSLDIEIAPLPECGSVFGTLFSTADASCTPGDNDVPIPFTMLQVTEQTTGDTYFTITDAVGYYELAVPAGEYLVIPLVNGEEPNGNCPNVLFTITGEVAVNVNVYAPATLFCPQMDLDICLFQQRRCFENSMSIYYYNEGNVPANNVVVTVELDSFYTDISSDRPFTQVGNILTFDIGTVPFCGFGWIQIYFTISCDAELGQTHCVNASISPSGFCEPDPVWNGSLINITDAVCDGDSVRFTVANVGTAPLSTPMSYVVVEDGIMMSASPIETVLLPASSSIEIALPANGSVYQLVTNQEPGAPVENPPSLLVQGCGDNPTTGFTNILPLGNGLPWMDTECRENTGSWDPNDKRGFPLGHTGNMIAPGTSLDYNIRFQNTGTDTAFTVVIRDTIGPALDMKSFRIGAASHPFTLDIDTNRVLTFTFDDILLPDSTTNPAGSQGGVTFTIDHDPSLEPGDLIENQAAIFFDFNEPIITNVSTHMIEIQGLPTSLRPVLAQRVPLKVFPNPATDWITVEMPVNEVSPGDVLVVSDAFGRDVQRTICQHAITRMGLDNLPNGYYVLTLVDRGGRAKGRAGFVLLK